MNCYAGVKEHFVIEVFKLDFIYFYIYINFYFSSQIKVFGTFYVSRFIFRQNAFQNACKC